MQRSASSPGTCSCSTWNSSSPGASATISSAGCLPFIASQTPCSARAWRDQLALFGAIPDPARVVDLRPHVAALACETLVVRGGNSDYLQPEMVEEMQRLNPHIRSAVVPDAGHYIHDDQPALFHQLVRDFLLPTP